MARASDAEGRALRGSGGRTGERGSPYFQPKFCPLLSPPTLFPFIIYGSSSPQAELRAEDMSAVELWVCRAWKLQGDPTTDTVTLGPLEGPRPRGDGHWRCPGHGWVLSPTPKQAWEQIWGSGGQQETGEAGHPPLASPSQSSSPAQGLQSLLRTCMLCWGS